jgi:hypothetical protein
MDGVVDYDEMEPRDTPVHRYMNTIHDVTSTCNILECFLHQVHKMNA